MRREAVEDQLRVWYTAGAAGPGGKIKIREEIPKMARKNDRSGMDEFSPVDPDEGSAPETEVAIAQRLWSDAQLRDIASFEDAIMAAETEGETIALASQEIGSGFVVLDDKDLLLKVPFLILEWRFNAGKYENDLGEKTDFVSMTVVTKNNDKYIVNDGSTGIARQLREYSDRTNKYGMLLAEKGLRVSRDYTVVVNGREINGTTYYIA